MTSTPEGRRLPEPHQQDTSIYIHLEIEQQPRIEM
jgi:hypothetical protein